MAVARVAKMEVQQGKSFLKKADYRLIQKQYIVKEGDGNQRRKSPSHKNTVYIMKNNVLSCVKSFI